MSEETFTETDTSFEELAMESFQELEKYNEEKLSSSDLQRLLEKTRQRREVLNQKLGKTPDITPRKRILEQNLTRENVPSVHHIQSSKDGSPGKRQCLRDDEMQVHPDTPAISGVKSRMQALAKQRGQFTDENKDLDAGSGHVPVNNDPEISSSQATISQQFVKQSPPAGRKGRFAHLAHTINSWEDDLSHPTIHRPEEPKPRWQPPKADVSQGPPKPPRQDITEGACQQTTAVKPPPPPPAPALPSTVASPKKTHAPPPPMSAVARLKSNPPTKPCPSLPNTTDNKQEPTTKPVAERMNELKTSLASNKVKAVDPAEQPLSTKLATWEQKIATPSKATVSKVQQPVRQVATPLSDKPPIPKPQSTEPRNVNQPVSTTESRVEKDDPAAQPVSSRMASWQQRVSESTPKKEEEPTAYSVNARMSAWEEMSSNNQVSYIKKVDPGSVSPSKKSPLKTPSVESAKKIQPPVKAIGRAESVTPSKAVHANIIEKVGHIKAAIATPNKLDATPGKVGSATKVMQQKLMDQVAHSKTDDIAEKLRRERMEELNQLQGRYQNGVLKEDKVVKNEFKHSDFLDDESAIGFFKKDKAPQVSLPVKDNQHEDLGKERREAIKAKARADESSDASYDFEKGSQRARQNSNNQSKPPIPSQQSKTKPSPSIYRLISQKRDNRPNIQGQKSDDSFDSTEDEELYPKRRLTSTEEEKEETEESSAVESNERFCTDSETDNREECPPQSQHPPHLTQELPPQRPCHDVMDDSDYDDVSLSAFVPASVRRQSVLPPGPQDEKEHRPPKPTQNPVASVPSNYRSGSNILVQQQQTSSSSLESNYSDQSSVSSDSRHRGYSETEDDTCESADIDDFLEEAMSEEEEEKPRAAPRKRRSHMMATTDENGGSLVYSVSMYRSRRNLRPNDSPKQKIVRNRQFDESIHEENIEMPTQLPPDLERKTIKERLQELQELVSQEQSVIMQTSNALNQCCSSNSYFQGSPEQVECNRLLLLACQKRQAYLTEIQRLKETGNLDPPGSGPKGSLTISDIRLPLKKEFVTKINTGTDNTVHYFLILIRNHAQVIVTQMLSTHDAMMRGSLDFPNLIKIHGICGSFKLNMEIYSMSVSREAIKDKKKKTPKKPAMKGGFTPAPSPGGPSAVRTTSFTLITSLPITMRALDKTCFTLERIPYLSPLHGTIYMRLKCLMEQNVEERGFLTMFEDVSGLGAWHRRWCGLQGNKLCFWKYPDEENRKEPMGYIDLKRCVTEKVGLIPRDICARPNTFELVTVRQPRRGEEDTLVSKTYNTMTTTRHMISADTKEERINWCNKINRSLANIRTWHSDAMRPIKVTAAKE